MSWGWISLNAAYLVYAASPAFKDMLRMRSFLLAATLLFIVYGVISDTWSVFFWNIPVAGIHAWRITTLARERRAIGLDDEAQAIRTLVFPTLEQGEFSRLWQLGVDRVATDEPLIVEGQHVDDIMIVVDGQVDVEIDGKHITQLGRLWMLGEMSSMTDDTASATVTARGEVRVRVWRRAQLERLWRSHPDMEPAFLAAIGRDLTGKILRSQRDLSPDEAPGID